MSPAHCSTSHPMEFGEPFTVVGDVEQIRDLLCGPQDHNEHCKGWRWFMYCADDKKRMDNVMAEVRAMAAERHSNMSSQQRADIELAHWQSLRDYRKAGAA